MENKKMELFAELKEGVSKDGKPYRFYNFYTVIKELGNLKISLKPLDRTGQELLTNLLERLEK